MEEHPEDCCLLEQVCFEEAGLAGVAYGLAERVRSLDAHALQSGAFSAAPKRSCLQIEFWVCCPRSGPSLTLRYKRTCVILSTSLKQGAALHYVTCGQASEHQIFLTSFLRVAQTSGFSSEAVDQWASSRAEAGAPNIAERLCIWTRKVRQSSTSAGAWCLCGCGGSLGRDYIGSLLWDMLGFM